MKTTGKAWRSVARSVLGALCVAACATSLPASAAGKYKVYLSMSYVGNDWQTEAANMVKAMAAHKDFADKIDLQVQVAGPNAQRQIQQINAMVQAGAKAIVVYPISPTALNAVVKNACSKGVIVIAYDAAIEEPCAYNVTIDQEEAGRVTAEWLVKNANGKSKIIELEGTTGSSPANDRKKGFDEAIKAAGGFQIVASQTGDFARDKGRQVAEALLQAHPDADIIYAHNDEMAMGAIAALEAAGKVPGKDVLVLSIDGGKEAVQAVVDGKIAAVVECNPRFGPKAFETMQRYAKGEAIDPILVNDDKFYDASNAAAELDGAY